MRRLPIVAVALALALALPHQGGSAPVAVEETEPATALGDEAQRFGEPDASPDRHWMTPAATASQVAADSTRQAAGEKNEFIQVLRATLRVTRILVNVILELLDRGLEMIA